MFQQIMDFFMNYGAWGLFIHAFADAVIFPIPAFFLQVSLSLLDPSNALWLATIGYIACLLGTPIGYLIGKGLGHSIMYKFSEKGMGRFRHRDVQEEGRGGHSDRFVHADSV